MKQQALWVPRPHVLSHSRQLGQCQEQYACWEREAPGSCSFSVQWYSSKAVYGLGSMYCLLTSFQVYYTYKCREIDYRYIMIYIYFWVNYNDLTVLLTGIMVSKGNHPQMALFQISELIEFTQIYMYLFGGKLQCCRHDVTWNDRS